MNIYAWKSFSKKVNSTKTPKASEAITVGNVFLKDGTGIMNPTLVLRRNSNINRQINYVQLLNHYYYVTDIRFVDGSNIEISCEVDPLATWKENLLGCECYVERTNDSEMINTRISDTMYPISCVKPVALSDECTYVNPQVRYATTSPETLFCVGFSVPVWSMQVGVGSWLIDSVNGIQKGTSSYVLMTSTQLGNLYALSSGLIAADFNPFDYIISCVALPTKPAITYEQMTIVAGKIKIGSSHEVSFNFISRKFDDQPYFADGSGIMSWFACNDVLDDEEHSTSGLLTLSLPTRSDTTYLNYDPFMSHTLYAGVFGIIPIPSDIRYSSGKILCMIAVDVTDGSAILTIYNGEYIIGRYNGNLGAKVPIQKLYSAGLADTISNVTKGLMATTTTVASVATGNPIGIVSGAAGLADTAASVYRSSIPKQHGLGVSDSASLNVYHPQFSLFTEYSGQMFTSGEDVLGHPCCKYAALGDFALGSLVIVKNPSVNIAGAYKSEIDAINQYLVSGVYLD